MQGHLRDELVEAQVAERRAMPAQQIDRSSRAADERPTVLLDREQRISGRFDCETRSGFGADDIREAPALTLIDALLAKGCRLQVHDPEAMANVRSKYQEQLVYADEPYAALGGADALAIMTEWKEFQNPDFDQMRKAMRGAVIFDGRNIYEPQQARQAGFTYYSVGRATVRPV